MDDGQRSKGKTGGKKGTSKTILGMADVGRRGMVEPQSAKLGDNDFEFAGWETLAAGPTAQAERRTCTRERSRASTPTLTHIHANTKTVTLFSVSDFWDKTYHDLR